MKKRPSLILHTPNLTSEFILDESGDLDVLIEHHHYLTCFPGESVAFTISAQDRERLCDFLRSYE